MNPSLNHYLSCLKRGLLAQVAWVIDRALWGLFLDWTSNVIGYSWPRVDKVKARLTRARSCQIGDQVGQATDQVHHGLTIRLKVFFWITNQQNKEFFYLIWMIIWAGVLRNTVFCPVYFFRAPCILFLQQYDLIYWFWGPIPNFPIIWRIFH